MAPTQSRNTRAKRKAEHLETEAPGPSGKLRRVQKRAAPSSPPPSRSQHENDIFNFPVTPPSRNTRSSARRVKDVVLRGYRAKRARRNNDAQAPAQAHAPEEVIEVVQEPEEEDENGEPGANEEDESEEVGNEREEEHVEDPEEDAEDSEEGEDESEEDEDEDEDEDGEDEQAHGNEGAEDQSQAKEARDDAGSVIHVISGGEGDDASAGSGTPTKKRHRGRPKGSSKKRKEQPKSSSEAPEEDPEEADEPQEPSQEVKELCVMQSEEASVVDSVDWLGLDEAWHAISSKTNEIIDLVQSNSLDLQTEVARNICEEIVVVIQGLGRVDAPDPDALQPLAGQIKLLKVELKPFQGMAGSGNSLPDDSGILQDCYAHVVPRLVYLIVAYAARFSEHYTPLADTEHLEAVMSVLAFALSFCETIRAARATLQSKVVRFTSRTILPNIRLIHECFVKELRRRLQAEKDRAEMEAAETRKRVVRRFEMEQERRRKLDLERRRKECWEWYSQRATSIRAAAAPHQPELESPTKPLAAWSWKMDHQLVETLWRKRKSSPGDRYLECLRCSRLQNLTPDLIRERAVELKPALKQYYGQELGRPTDWIDSIS